MTYRQEEGPNFDKYLTEMRKLSNDCELDGLKDSLLADMMIIGLRDKRIQESLLLTVVPVLHTIRLVVLVIRKDILPKVVLRITQIKESNKRVK